MLNIKDSVFNSTVTIGGDSIAAFDNCTFAAQGTSKKDNTTPGLRISDSAIVTVENSTFKNQGYSAINILTSGEVKIKNNVFECGTIYNPIEASVSSGAEQTNVSIEGNVFNGQCGNNYVNFYHMANGAHVILKNNKYTGASSDSEILRLSNVNNSTAVFDVIGDSYIYADNKAGDYTSFLMCQDFTNKLGKFQDFSRYTVNLTNVKCNGIKIEEGKIAQGKIFFVYEDGKGIIEGNDPIINIK